jgi:hypothetical protein
MSDRLVVDTGFTSIFSNPGPDTLRLTVRRTGDHQEMIFCLSEYECLMLERVLENYRNDVAKRGLAE